jgi:hypothetical protein
VLARCTELRRPPSNLLQQQQPNAAPAQSAHQPQPDLAAGSAAPAPAVPRSHSPLLREQEALQDIIDSGQLKPGEAGFPFGIDISCDRARCSIGQSAYATALLERHGLSDCKSCSTPTAVEFTATVAKAAAADSVANRAHDAVIRDYQAVMSGLMFAMICTRLDITCAIDTLAQLAIHPLPAHGQAQKSVLRYPRSSVDRRITYTGTDADTDAADTRPELVGDSVASWAGGTAAAASRATPAGGVISHVTALLELHGTCCCTPSRHAVNDGSARMLGLSESSSRGAVGVAS